jgi:methanogenic corrinoid protein MtbC1
MQDDLFAELRENLMAAEPEAAIAATNGLLAAGVDPAIVLQDGLAAAMLELGARWNRGEVYLPEVVAAADVFKACSDIVEPILVASGTKEAGHLFLTATVKGDLHDLGKNMVGAMLKTAGFEVHDLGKDVATEAIVDAVRQMRPAILGLSAMLTTTVPHQREVIAALEAAGLRDAVKVMVGGAPVTEDWAKDIGADGFAPDAPRSVQIALGLIGAPVT